MKTEIGWLGFVPKMYPHFFQSISYHFPSVRLKNILIKISWLLARKPAKVGKQRKMTLLCTQTFPFRYFVVVSNQYDSKMFQPKFYDFRHKNSLNLQNNLKWLGFPLKTSEHPCLGRFVLVWHRIGPMNFRTYSFRSNNTIQKSSSQNFITFGMKTCQSCKPTQDDYVLHLNLPHIIFGHFAVISHQYGSKMFWSKFHEFWHENWSNLQTNLESHGFATQNFRT